MAHSETPADTDPDCWTVTVAGAVANPQTVRASELTARQSVPVETATDCAGEMPARRWSGVPVGALLDRATPRSDASHGLVRSADPDFACGFELDRLRDALLAVRVDGDPIPADEGGPVRLLFADADCWERVKWVSRIAVLDHPPDAADTARDLVLGE